MGWPKARPFVRALCTATLNGGMGHDEACHNRFVGTAEAHQKAERIAAVQKAFGLVPEAEQGVD